MTKTTRDGVGCFHLPCAHQSEAQARRVRDLRKDVVGCEKRGAKGDSDRSIDQRYVMHGVSMRSSKRALEDGFLFFGDLGVCEPASWSCTVRAGLIQTVWAKWDAAGCDVMSRHWHWHDEVR